MQSIRPRQLRFKESQMSPAEKALLHAFVRDLADKYLPELLNEEVGKIPAPYGELVKAALAALEPALIAKLDAIIDAAI